MRERLTLWIHALLTFHFLSKFVWIIYWLKKYVEYTIRVWQYENFLVVFIPLVVSWYHYKGYSNSQLLVIFAGKVFVLFLFSYVFFFFNFFFFCALVYISHKHGWWCPGSLVVMLWGDVLFVCFLIDLLLVRYDVLPKHLQRHKVPWLYCQWEKYKEIKQVLYLSHPRGISRKGHYSLLLLL